MTSNSEKLRSLFLAGLMVFSVFAGTVALTGSAAAVGGNTTGGPSAQDAAHYVGNSGNAVVEVSFDEEIQSGSATITVTLEDGSTPVDGTSINPSDINGGQLKVAAGDVYNDVDTVTVTDIEDQDGNTATVTEDVQFASSSVDTTTDGDEFDAYQGENVSIYANDTLETTFDIEGDDISYDVVRGSGNNSEAYVWDTSGQELGDYNISERSASSEVTVTIQDLGLSIEPDSDSFEDDEQINATVDMSDIERPVSARLIDDSGDTVAYDNRTTDTDGKLDASFPEQDDGNYTLEVEDLNSGITATSDEFEVVDAGDADADFGQSVYEDERGDVVNISVEMSNSDTAAVQVGTSDDDNYYAVTEVEDDDGDGVAYVEFNSLYAGNGSNSQVLTAGDDDTNVGTVHQGGQFNGSNAPLGSDILESAQYELLVESGDYTGAGSEIGDEDNVGTLSLQERSTENAQIWTAPEGEFSTLSSGDADDIAAYAEAGNLTQADAIAQGDTLVVQVEASGLEGALETESDDTQAYRDLSNESRLFNLTLEEGTSAPNADPLSVNVGDLSDSGVVYDADADTHYVVLNSSEFLEEYEALPIGPTHEDGDTYAANFTVWGDSDANDLSDADESVQDDFDIEDRDASIDVNEDDEVVVEAASGQEVTGTTNLAPGTELTIRMRSTTDGSPFLKQPEPTVQEDGSFTAVADFDNVSPGATFDANVRLGSAEIGDTEDGVVVEATETTENETNATGTPEDTDTPEGTDMTDTGTPPETDMTDMTDMTDEGTPTDGSGPGFGAAIALIALVAAALLAVRRNN